MSAFFVVASFGLVVLLMFKRESIRQIQFTKISSSEMGTKLREYRLTWQRLGGIGLLWVLMRRCGYIVGIAAEWGQNFDIWR